MNALLYSSPGMIYRAGNMFLTPKWTNGYLVNSIG